MMMKSAGILIAAALAIGTGPAAPQEPGSTGSAGLDGKLASAFEELARTFDEKKDPEAAHLFAECAIGLGIKGESTTALRKKWEREVYYGRARGGVVLKETAPIDAKLAELSKEYRTVLDGLLKKATGKTIAQDERVRLQQVILRYELARGSAQYVRATQRFNELRSKMKLRAILWDYEASSKLILAAAYMGETGDYGTKDKSDQSAPLYSEAVEFGKQYAVRSPRIKFVLEKYADHLRSFALVRDDILNPDVRRLWLGHWTLGSKHKEMTLYAIPRLDYREDIPTPSRHYSGKTVAQDRDLWADIEETVNLSPGLKIIVAHYPYDGEPDAPWAFGEGEDFEHDWADPKVKDLRKCGLPIMLRLFATAKLADVEAGVRTSKGNVPCRMYLNGDERVPLGDFATVLLLPERHLEKGVPHTVAIKGKIEGTPFEKKWSFTTREK